jgi:hypothetical protein
MQRFLVLALTLGFCTSVHAHSLWLEPAEGGYKAFYGEPAADEIENGEKLDNFAQAKAVGADGKVVALERQSDHYRLKSASPIMTLVNPTGIVYTPEGRPGAKYVQYARFVVAGQAPKGGPKLFLDLRPVAGKPDAFELRKDGKPFPGQKVELHSPNGWLKEHKTDAQGRVSVETLWPGRYVLAAYFGEKKAWEEGGKKFETLGHMASAAFVVAGEEPRPRHFEGKAPESIGQAVQALRGANPQLAAILQKKSLSPEDLGQVHLLSYTLESALQVLRDGLGSAAEALEEAHLASEGQDAKKVRKAGGLYLQKTGELLGE